MASPEHAGRPIDTGASYFTVSDDRFGHVVGAWRRRGLARPWSDAFEVYERVAIRRSGGPMRWAADAGLRALVQDLADTAGLLSSRPRWSSSPAARPGSRWTGSRPRRWCWRCRTRRPGRSCSRRWPPSRAGLYAGYDPVLVLSAGWPERA